MPGHTTKFGVGDVVWLLHANRAMSGVVSGVYLSIQKTGAKAETYDLDNVSAPDSAQCVATKRSAELLYTSREALLASL